MEWSLTNVGRQKNPSCHKLEVDQMTKYLRDKGYTVYDLKRNRLKLDSAEWEEWEAGTYDILWVHKNAKPLF